MAYNVSRPPANRKYAEGMIVTYKGKKYERNGFSLTSSPTPYDGSKYWTLID